MSILCRRMPRALIEGVDVGWHRPLFAALPAVPAV